jgi:enamine deaminase RidA (YjgF/YER057c/UK114 family)
MAEIKHLNPSGAVPPYRNLFHSVTIIPPNTTLAYISTQWAGDDNSELQHPDDYRGQSKYIWTRIARILKELGCGMKDVVHRKVVFRYVPYPEHFARGYMIFHIRKSGRNRRRRRSETGEHDMD